MLNSGANPRCSTDPTWSYTQPYGRYSFSRRTGSCRTRPSCTGRLVRSTLPYWWLTVCNNGSCLCLGSISSLSLVMLLDLYSWQSNLDREWKFGKQGHDLREGTSVPYCRWVQFFEECSGCNSDPAGTGWSPLSMGSFHSPVISLSYNPRERLAPLLFDQMSSSQCNLLYLQHSRT